MEISGVNQHFEDAPKQVSDERQEQGSMKVPLHASVGLGEIASQGTIEAELAQEAGEEPTEGDRELMHERRGSIDSAAASSMVSILASHPMSIASQPAGQTVANTTVPEVMPAHNLPTPKTRPVVASPASLYQQAIQVGVIGGVACIGLFMALMLLV